VVRVHGCRALSLHPSLFREVGALMSQKMQVTGYKLVGRPYTGMDSDGVDRFAVSGLETATWLGDASRTRFNQQRSTRQKYVYIDDERVLDDDGKPVLVPIGDTVSKHTHAEARRMFSFLAAVPAMVLHLQLRDENTAWFAATKRRSTNISKGMKAGAMPGFKARNHTDTVFGSFARNGKSQVVTFTRTGKRSGVLRIGGMNPSGKTAPGYGLRWSLTIRVRFPKTFIVRDFSSMQVNVTRSTVVLTNAPLPIVRTRTGAVIGIDVGVAVNIATSDGAFLNPPDTSGLEKERKSEQRAMARSREAAKADHRNYWESKGYQAHKAKAAALSAKITNIRTDWRHKVTTKLVVENDYIAVEKLGVKRMMVSAAGTLDNPGTNVAAKKGLNRGMGNLAAGTIFTMLKYKAAASGVHLEAVAPHYTSQRCHQCGHIAAGNRETQSVFRCIMCAHTDNADTNAALNILARALGIWDGTRPKQVRERKTETSSLVTAVPV
jgi:putative transposase